MPPKDEPEDDTSCLLFPEPTHERRDTLPSRAFPSRLYRSVRMFACLRSFVCVLPKLSVVKGLEAVLIFEAADSDNS